MRRALRVRGKGHDGDPGKAKNWCPYSRTRTSTTWGYTQVWAYPRGLSVKKYGEVRTSTASRKPTSCGDLRPFLAFTKSKYGQVRTSTGEVAVLIGILAYKYGQIQRESTPPDPGKGPRKGTAKVKIPYARPRDPHSTRGGEHLPGGVAFAISGSSFPACSNGEGAVKP